MIHNSVFGELEFEEGQYDAYKVLMDQWDYA